MQLIHRFDNFFIGYIQGFKAAWFGRLMALATQAGNGPVVVLFMATLAISAHVRGESQIQLATLITIGLMLFYNGLKFIFRRPRPDNAYAAQQLSSSFPSGHAADSVASYGLSGYLALHYLGPLGIIIAALCALMFTAIGISRIYLGAHYPTDVVGGWAFGAVGLTILIRALAI